MWVIFPTGSSSSHSSWMDGLWLLMPLKGVAEIFLLSIQSFNFMCLFTVPYCIATKHVATEIEIWNVSQIFNANL
jgi:hypothetical protein